MKNLYDAVSHFKSDIYPGLSGLFNELASSQAPNVLFITCSDSRVVPSLITDASPGELFVLRNVGNIVPPAEQAGDGESAVLEYAVKALGVGHIVVCGHSNCGAMHGVVSPGNLATLPHVAGWLKNADETAQKIKESLPEADEATRWKAAIELNVVSQLDNVRSYSFVADALEAGSLQLHGWVYDIAAGEVVDYDSERGRFVEYEG